MNRGMRTGTADLRKMASWLAEALGEAGVSPLLLPYYVEGERPEALVLYSPSVAAYLYIAGECGQDTVEIFRRELEEPSQRTGGATRMHDILGLSRQKCLDSRVRAALEKVLQDGRPVQVFGGERPKTLADVEELPFVRAGLYVRMGEEVTS